MSELPVAFLPHPVSPELKYAIKRKGFRIVDARFAPADYELPKELAELAEAPVTPAASGGDGPQRPKNKA